MLIRSLMSIPETTSFASGGPTWTQAVVEQRQLNAGQAGILTATTQFRAMDQTVDVLRQDAHGIWRVSGTRVSLDSLVYAFWDGSSPETIAEQFDSVPLSDIYLALGYS